MLKILAIILALLFSALSALGITAGAGECILGQSPDGSCNFGGGVALTPDQILENAVPIPRFFDYNSRGKRREGRELFEMADASEEGKSIFVERDEGMDDFNFVDDNSDSETASQDNQMSITSCSMASSQISNNQVLMVTREMTLTIPTTVKGPKEVLTIERVTFVTVQNEIAKTVATTLHAVSTVHVTSTAVKLVTQEFTRTATTMMMSTLTTFGRITETLFQTRYSTVAQARKVEKMEMAEEEEEEITLMPPIEAIMEHNGYYGKRAPPRMPPNQKQYNAPVYQRAYAQPPPPPMAANINTVYLERTRLMAVTDVAPVTLLETSIMTTTSVSVATTRIKETTTNFRFIKDIREQQQEEETTNSAASNLLNVNVMLSIVLAIVLSI